MLRQQITNVRLIPTDKALTAKNAEWLRNTLPDEAVGQVINEGLSRLRRIKCKGSFFIVDNTTNTGPHCA